MRCNADATSVGIVWWIRPTEKLETQPRVNVPAVSCMGYEVSHLGFWTSRRDIRSIDGGGVRGIVSVETMRHLERFCFGIPFRLLVDMVVGTSIGGIIALCCAVKAPALSTAGMLEQFKGIVESIFPPDTSGLMGYLYKLTYMFHKTKYDSPERTVCKLFKPSGASPTQLRAYNPQRTAFAAAVAVHAQYSTADRPVLFGN
jgi:hypothetical protein